MRYIGQILFLPNDLRKNDFADPALVKTVELATNLTEFGCMVYSRAL